MQPLHLLVILLITAPLAACGGGGGEDAAAEGEGGGDQPVASEGAASAGIEMATPARWPRPTPPEPYHVEEIESAGVITGTITATREGRGTAYEMAPGEGCPDGLAPTLPSYPKGPLAAAVVTLNDVRAGIPVIERAPAFAVGACELEPRVALATVRAPVTFRVADGEAQSVRWIDPAGHADLGALELPADGAELERRPRAPGRVQLRGEPYLGTRGWLVVVDHPYAALTGADGTFRLEGVPAGEHTLTVWHEAFGERSVAIQVEPAAELRQDVSLSPDGA